MTDPVQIIVALPSAVDAAPVALSTPVSTPVVIPSPLIQVNAVPAPAAAAALRYMHTQVAPLAEWTVNHNLGARPTVAVFTSGWVEIGASVTHLSDNQTHIAFNGPQAGFAIFI